MVLGDNRGERSDSGASGARIIMTGQIELWLTEAVDNAPVLAFMAVALYDLRRNLIACMRHNQHITDILFERLLSRVNE